MISILPSRARYRYVKGGFDVLRTWFGIDSWSLNWTRRSQYVMSVSSKPLTNTDQECVWLSGAPTGRGFPSLKGTAVVPTMKGRRT